MLGHERIYGKMQKGRISFVHTRQAHSHSLERIWERACRQNKQKRQCETHKHIKHRHNIDHKGKACTSACNQTLNVSTALTLSDSHSFNDLRVVVIVAPTYPRAHAQQERGNRANKTSSLTPPRHLPQSRLDKTAGVSSYPWRRRSPRSGGRASTRTGIQTWRVSGGR